MTQRRVVVTGMGAVTPFGVTVDHFWDALIEGRSGITPVSLFDAAEFSARIGGECRDFRPADHIERKTIRRLDRYAQYALAVCAEAYRASGVDLDREDPYRVAVIFGTGIGGLNELEEQHARLTEKGPARSRPSPFQSSW